MILEVIRMVEEDGAMLSIQSVQLTSKLNLCPRVDQVHHSAKTSFYQQIISWAQEITYWLVIWAGFQAGDWGE